MDKLNKILIFGGSFNPPTLAHEAIIARCLELPQFDAVWVMLSGDRLDKKIAADDQDRLRLMELIKIRQFGNNPRLAISDFELALPRPTQTYRTVQDLANKYRDTKFWFAFGSDAYWSMPSWQYGGELRKLPLVIFERDPSKRVTGKNIMHLQLAPEYSDISSTQARQALAAGESLDGLVSAPVARYLLAV